MNQSNVALLDLPNEMLLIILKKLDNIDVLYSLFDVDNQRLDTVVQEKTFTNTLNFVLTTLTDDIFSISNPIVDRFCISILPRIHHNVQSLILDSVSMERILLAADYPNLTELKLFNFNGKIASRYFTVEAPFHRIFQRQITYLNLVFEKDFDEISVAHYSKDVYEYILKFFENLKHLSITGLSPHFPPLILHELPLTTFLSSTLNKLCIDVASYPDCLALLDGRLQQLTTLIIDIIDVSNHSSNVYNMDDLPNLKSFSLTTFSCLSDTYNTKILPLLHRMANLEELTLYLTIKNRTAFIDGTHIYNEILAHMPRLHTFHFYISTNTEIDSSVRHLSKDDIQRTFSNTKYQQVDCIVDYRSRIATCHVFSLPFMFDQLQYIGNIFPIMIFNHVRKLGVHDEVPFKHEFFHRIAWCFPLLKELSVINKIAQSQISNKFKFNDIQLYSIVKYPYLTSLRLRGVHINYVDQFLNQKKTHLPHLTKLIVDYDYLRILTKNFKSDTTRLNCMKVKKLILNATIVHSKDFYVYFPLLEIVQ